MEALDWWNPPPWKTAGHDWQPGTKAPAVLTPEQVSALSDVELSEAVAREVFGAEITRGFPSNFAERKPFALLMDGVYHLWREGSAYDLPLTPLIASSSHAIVERLSKRWAAHSKGTFTAITTYRGEEVEVRFEFAYDATNDVFPDEVWATSPSVGRSTFEVALLAVLTLPALSA